MFALFLASVASQPTVSAAPPCPPQRGEAHSQIVDVCDTMFSGDAVYSSTVSSSLVPGPATQQVILFRQGSEWKLRVFGYRWQPGTSVVRTYQNTLPIAQVDALRIVNETTAARFSRLAKLAYYGSDDVICTDGARTELTAALGGRRYSAAQHSCAGDSDLKKVSNLFREIALKYDPESAPFIVSI